MAIVGPEHTDSKQRYSYIPWLLTSEKSANNLYAFLGI